MGLNLKTLVVNTDIKKISMLIAAMKIMIYNLNQLKIAIWQTIEKKEIFTTRMMTNQKLSWMTLLSKMMMISFNHCAMREIVKT